jgi:hypothetical protein
VGIPQDLTLSFLALSRYRDGFNGFRGTNSKIAISEAIQTIIKTMNGIKLQYLNAK